MNLASILLVDPDADLRARMARHLREIGHDVSESESATSALRKIRDLRPDLMICDYALPDLSGVELLNDVRGRCDHRQREPQGRRRWRLRFTRAA